MFGACLWEKNPTLFCPFEPNVAYWSHTYYCNSLDLLTWRCISSIGLCGELVTLCYITSMAPSRFSCLAQEPIKYPIDMNHQSDVLKVSSILLFRVICFSSAGVCVFNCTSSVHGSLDPVIYCYICRTKCRFPLL